MKNINCGSCGELLGEIDGHYLYFGKCDDCPIQLNGKWCNRASGKVAITCACGNNVDVDTFLNRTPIRAKACQNCHSLAGDACRHPKSICKGKAVRYYGSCKFWNQEGE